MLDRTILIGAAMLMVSGAIGFYLNVLLSVLFLSPRAGWFNVALGALVLAVIGCVPRSISSAPSSTTFGYLREQRLQRARRLLEQDRHSVGYRTGRDLARAFKQRFGIAPSGWSRAG